MACGEVAKRRMKLRETGRSFAGLLVINYLM